MYEPDHYVAILLPHGDEVLAYRGATVSVSEVDVEVAIMAEVDVESLGKPSPAMNVKPDWYRRWQSGSALSSAASSPGEVRDAPYAMKVLLMTFPLNEDGESGNVVPWTADVAEQFRKAVQEGEGGIILRLTKHWPPPAVESRPSPRHRGVGDGA